MSDTRSFTTTPAKLGQLALLLQGHGITVDLTQSGQAQNGDWSLSWTILPAADPGTVDASFTVLKHPFAQEGFLWSRLSALLA